MFWLILLGIIGIIIVGVYQGVQSAEKLSNNKQNQLNTLTENGFNSEKVCSTFKTTVAFDISNKQIAVCNHTNNIIQKIKFEDVIECEIIEDNTTIAKGGIGRALVGGVLAGGVGAIVGAGTRSTSNVTNNLAVRIITADIKNSLVMITLIETMTKRDTEMYKMCMNTAQEIYSTVISVIKANENG